jgi:hypothetical protein
VPQGRHAHALLPAGVEGLSELFPGIVDDLAAAGAVIVVLSQPEFAEAVRAALANLLADAVDALHGSEHGDKLHRAVATTFIKGAPTQEVAAGRLALPFSTYRRHLAAGVEAVTTWLWERELHGAPAQPGGCRLGVC